MKKTSSKTIIKITNLQKIFQVEIKKSGFSNKLKSLFKPRYKQVIAVSDINFSVQAWEKIAFLGPNGAGKSTTIKMLTWILHPTSWSMSVAGFNPSTQRKKLVYTIGAVFGQTSRLRYHLTPMDTFKVMAQLFDVDKDEATERIWYLIDKFEIRDLIDTPVRKLSLGQRMRCEIVSALIHKPKIIFLDEPTIGLDIIAKQKLRETINEINASENTTIFLTSHDLWDIEKVCDRVVIINHGKILYDGQLHDLRKNYVKTKIIKINISDESTFKPLDFMKIKQQESDFIQFEIPNNKENLKRTFEYLMATYQVEDIEITDPDIEDIIKEFY